MALATPWMRQAIDQLVGRGGGLAGLAQWRSPENFPCASAFLAGQILGLSSLLRSASSVPVRNRRGEVIAALNIGTQAGRVNLQTMNTQLLPALKESALRLGQLLS